MTYEKETSTGVIQGTGINITQIAPGIIKFTVARSIEANKTWTGIVNVITLMPSVTGNIQLTLVME